MKHITLILACLLTVYGFSQTNQTPPDGMPPEMGDMPGPPPGEGNGGPAGQRPPGEPGGPGNSAAAYARMKGVFEVKGASISESDKTYTATETDQSAILVRDSSSFSLNDAIINKTGNSSDNDASSLTGLNAAFLAIGKKATARLRDVVINTDADGANAVLATMGATIDVQDIVINTTRDGSRGLHATQQGIITARDITITTTGAHCAALATDRGSGTVTVSDAVLTTSGDGSPGIYSTGNITVHDVNIESGMAEAAVIEGKNSIIITDSKLIGGYQKAVMLYQSFSGDAEVGTSRFSMTGGSLTGRGGPLFFTTNTQTEIYLKQVTLINKDAGNCFYKAGANRWGRKGSNGSDCKMTLDAQSVSGSLICDSLSTCEINLINSSEWTGVINQPQTAKSVNLNLDASSRLILTADSYIDAFKNEDASCKNISGNGFNLRYNAENTANGWLKGTTIKLAGGGSLMPR